MKLEEADPVVLVALGFSEGYLDLEKRHKSNGIQQGIDFCIGCNF